MTDFNLDKALHAISSRVTDEQREEQEKMNHAGRLVLAANSMERRVSLARAQEQGILEQIRLLETLPESHLRTNRISAALDRLSELYAEQGRYEEAIEVTPNEERRAQYQQILNAIERPDHELCECPPETMINRKTNAQIKQPMMQRLGSVVSLKHGHLVTLKVCRACGDAQAS
jgi:hypothetical protein